MERFGPSNATLTVRTFREGIGASAGHDLELVVTHWQATAELGDTGRRFVALDADGGSLEVRDAHGGVKPLTDTDRAQIVRNIERKGLRGLPIGFRSTAVLGDGPYEIEGELTLAGRTARVAVRLEVEPDGRLTATVPLLQSRWGITPFRALMGALRVRDEVVVTVETTLTA